MINNLLGLKRLIILKIIIIPKKLRILTFWYIFSLSWEGTAHGKEPRMESNAKKLQISTRRITSGGNVAHFCIQKFAVLFSAKCCAWHIAYEKPDQIHFCVSRNKKKITATTITNCSKPVKHTTPTCWYVDDAHFPSISKFVPSFGSRLVGARTTSNKSWRDNNKRKGTKYTSYTFVRMLHSHRHTYTCPTVYGHT